MIHPQRDMIHPQRGTIHPQRKFIKVLQRKRRRGRVCLRRSHQRNPLKKLRKSIMNLHILISTKKNQRKRSQTKKRSITKRKKSQIIKNIKKKNMENKKRRVES